MSLLKKLYGRFLQLITLKAMKNLMIARIDFRNCQLTNLSLFHCIFLMNHNAQYNILENSKSLIAW